MADEAGGGSDNEDTPVIHRSAALIEYANARPASANGKPRSLISKVANAVASANQYGDDSEPVDGDSWVLDGWTENDPSVLESAQQASSRLNKYSKDVPHALLALGGRRAASAGVEAGRSPGKGGPVARRRHAGPPLDPARRKGPATYYKPTNLEVGDESDVEPSAIPGRSNARTEPPAPATSSNGPPAALRTSVSLSSNGGGGDRSPQASSAWPAHLLVMQSSAPQQQHCFPGSDLLFTYEPLLPDTGTLLVKGCAPQRAPGDEPSGTGRLPNIQGTGMVVRRPSEQMAAGHIQQLQLNPHLLPHQQHNAPAVVPAQLQRRASLRQPMGSTSSLQDAGQAQAGPSGAAARGPALSRSLSTPHPTSQPGAAAAPYPLHPDPNALDDISAWGTTTASSSSPRHGLPHPVSASSSPLPPPGPSREAARMAGPSPHMPAPRAGVGGGEGATGGGSRGPRTEELVAALGLVPDVRLTAQDVGARQAAGATTAQAPANRNPAPAGHYLYQRSLATAQQARGSQPLVLVGGTTGAQRRASSVERRDAVAAAAASTSGPARAAAGAAHGAGAHAPGVPSALASAAEGADGGLAAGKQRGTTATAANIGAGLPAASGVGGGLRGANFQQAARRRPSGPSGAPVPAAPRGGGATTMVQLTPRVVALDAAGGAQQPGAAAANMRRVGSDTAVDRWAGLGAEQDGMGAGGVPRALSPWGQEARGPSGTGSGGGSAPSSAGSGRLR